MPLFLFCLRAYCAWVLPLLSSKRENPHVNQCRWHHSDESWDPNSPIEQDESTFPWTGCLCSSPPWHLAHWEPAAELRRMKQEGNTRHEKHPWVSHLGRHVKLKSAPNVISLSYHRRSPEMLILSTCKVLSLCF